MKLSQWPYGVLREFCHLQLRHICELVAIGSLVIQGDYTYDPGVKDEYNPQKIFRSLDKAYPDPFPQPMTVTYDGTWNFVANSKPGAMTRKELENLWSRTGNYLHRLRIANFFRVEELADAEFWPGIDDHILKLELLLNPHAIGMYKPKILVVGSLDGDNGKPNIISIIYRKSGEVSVNKLTGKGETPFWRAL
jgi:hypothetical protein